MPRPVLVATLAGALLASPSLARGDDTVRVPGHVFRGTIVEVRRPVLLRLRETDGSEVLVPWGDVRSVEHTGSSSSPAPELAPPPRARTRWYGWQILALDGSAVLLLGVDALPVSLPVYLLGGPTVHLVHGSGTRALGSALLRVLVPLTLAGAGAYLAGVASHAQNAQDDGLPAGATGLLAGGAIGIVGASIVDATVLAREPLAPADSHASAALPLAPLVSLRSGGEAGHLAWFGVLGAF